MTPKNPPQGSAKTGRPGLGTEAPLPRWWRRPKLWAWLLIGGPLVLVAVHGGLWYLATQQIIDQTTAQLRNLARQGWTTYAEAPVRGGYPWVADVTIPGIRLAGPLLAWEAETLVVRLALLRPATVRIAAEGQQSARLGNASPVKFTAARTEAIVDLTTSQVANIELDGLVAATPAGPLRADTLRLRLDRTTPGLGFDLTQATLPAMPEAWKLGNQLDHAGIDVTAIGGLPADNTAPALQAWRDAGGRIDIPRIALAWNQVKMAGQMQIALTDLLQPDASGQLRVGGYGALIDTLVATTLLTPTTAQVMRAVLGMLARPDADTGPDSVAVPVTLRDRSLSIGRIPLLRMPEFVWPPGK